MNKIWNNIKKTFSDYFEIFLIIGIVIITSSFIILIVDCPSILQLICLIDLIFNIILFMKG